MAKVKYYAKENSSIGTHSFYAVPVPNGTLSFDELLDEAMDGKSVEPSIAKACVTEFMKAVKRNVLKGCRCIWRRGHHRGWRQSRWQPGRRYDWRGAGGMTFGM